MSAAASRPWEQLLRAPFPCDHILQFYTDEEVLIRALSGFVGSGLELGEAVVVIATAEHRAAVARSLTADGRNLAKVAEQGAFVSLDAERCLAKFMIDGMPDPAAFRATVAPVLDRLRDAGFRKIRRNGQSAVASQWSGNGTPRRAVE